MGSISTEKDVLFFESEENNELMYTFEQTGGIL